MSAHPPAAPDGHEQSDRRRRRRRRPRGSIRAMTARTHIAPRATGQTRPAGEEREDDPEELGVEVGSDDPLRRRPDRDGRWRVPAASAAAPDSVGGGAQEQERRRDQRSDPERVEQDQDPGVGADQRARGRPGPSGSARSGGPGTIPRGSSRSTRRWCPTFQITCWKKPRSYAPVPEPVEPSPRAGRRPEHGDRTPQDATAAATRPRTMTQARRGRTTRRDRRPRQCHVRGGPVTTGDRDPRHAAARAPLHRRSRAGGRRSGSARDPGRRCSDGRFAPTSPAPSERPQRGGVELDQRGVPGPAAALRRTGREREFDGSGGRAPARQPRARPRVAP